MLCCLLRYEFVCLDFETAGDKMISVQRIKEPEAIFLLIIKIYSYYEKRLIKKL
jgi:hypothetical protein